MGNNLDFLLLSIVIMQYIYIIYIYMYAGFIQDFLLGGGEVIVKVVVVYVSYKISRFLGGGKCGWGGNSRAPPPLYETLCMYILYIYMYVYIIYVHVCIYYSGY